SPDVPARAEVTPAAPPTSAGTSAPAGLCYGSFVDPDGRPIDEATFTLWSRGSGERNETFQDGVFAMSALAPGTYALEIIAPGFRKNRTEFAMSERADPVRLTLVLERAILLPVKLLTTDGQPLAGAVTDPIFPLWSIALIATKDPIQRLPLTTGPS